MADDHLLDDFWLVPAAISDLAMSFESPAVDALLVKRLGPPAFARNHRDFLALTRSAIILSPPELPCNSQPAIPAIDESACVALSLLGAQTCCQYVFEQARNLLPVIRTVASTERTADGVGSLQDDAVQSGFRERDVERRRPRNHRPSRNVSTPRRAAPP